MKKIFAGICTFALFATMTRAEELRFTSGPQQVSLVELYTSEGCSSCPPAEAWLGRLQNDPGLWKHFVPLAFHVDYWDRLGWPDRFASPEWTARQNHYASLWSSDSIYTPEMVRDGREWRDWAAGHVPPNEQKTGDLIAKSADGKTWSVTFHPANASSGEWEVNLAVLGAGIAVKVGAGENGGRTLSHDFVVLNLQTAPLKEGVASLTSKGLRETPPRRAVAIWITRKGEMAPVQAVGGWIATR